MELEDLRRGLLRPAAYDEPPAEVGLVETHISLLFFTERRVYKLKKPVDLGFLDYSTPALRRHFCEEEVRLNERLAPGVMLGVVPVVAVAGGGVRMGTPGELDRVEAVDHAVAMVRLPAEGMLSARLGRGQLDNALLNELAALLARFHADAATGEGVDEHGAPAAVARNVAGNLELLEQHVAPHGLAALSPAMLAALRRAQEGFLQEREGLLRERVRAGRIREGHGDLHADNVCVVDGRVVAYDCIEFSAAFRCGDVAADLAFLAMDLDKRGFAAASSYLCHRYAALAGDAALQELLDFYKTYRALVRCKVALLTAAGAGDDGERSARARSEARAYAHLAVGYALPRAVVLLHGATEAHAAALARPLRAACLHPEPGRTLADDLGDALRLGRSAVVRVDAARGTSLDALRRLAQAAGARTLEASPGPADPATVLPGSVERPEEAACARWIDALLA